MIPGSSLTVYVAGLLRIAMVMAIVAVSVTMWAPASASEIDAGYGDTVSVGHPAHHGSLPDDEQDRFPHAWACAVVCIGSGEHVPDLLASPFLRVIALDAMPPRDPMRSGHVPDPALRPPRVEALF